LKPEDKSGGHIGIHTENGR